MTLLWSSSKKPTDVLLNAKSRNVSWRCCTSPWDWAMGHGIDGQHRKHARSWRERVGQGQYISALMSLHGGRSYAPGKAKEWFCANIRDSADMWTSVFDIIVYMYGNANCISSNLSLLKCCHREASSFRCLCSQLDLISPGFCFVVRLAHSARQTGDEWFICYGLQHSTPLCKKNIRVVEKWCWQWPHLSSCTKLNMRRDEHERGSSYRGSNWLMAVPSASLVLSLIMLCTGCLRGNSLFSVYQWILSSIL